MAKGGITLSSTVIAILAIIAGILILLPFGLEFLKWVLGIFLIVWGILSLIRK